MLSAPAAQLLRPILDMYMDSVVALVGCHAAGIERRSCELDVLIVGNESRPPTSVKMTGVYLDLIFIQDRDALKPENPEHAAAMAHAKHVRDTSLVVSTGSAAGAAVLADSYRKSTRARLASALKSLGRVDEAFSQSSIREADFWLQAAAYDYGHALLYSKEVLPAPSHLLGQLKFHSKGTARSFEAFSKGAALEKSSRNTCGSRLEGIAILHDVLRERREVKAPRLAGWPPAKLEILKAKAEELGSRLEHAEGYSYLGQEMVQGMLEVASADDAGKGAVGSLFTGEDKLLSDRLLEELGLVRDRPTIETTLEVMNEQVSSLARKV